MTAKRLPRPASTDSLRHTAAKLLRDIIAAHRTLQTLIKVEAAATAGPAARSDDEIRAGQRALESARAGLEHAIDAAAEFFAGRPTSTAAASTTPTRGSRELLAALSLHFASVRACEAVVGLLDDGADELPGIFALRLASRRSELGRKTLELLREADQLSTWLDDGNPDLGEPRPAAWIAERQSMLLELDLCAGLLDGMSGSGPVHSQRIRRLIASTLAAGEPAVADEVLKHYGRGFLLPAGTFRGGSVRIEFRDQRPPVAFEVDPDGGLRTEATVVDRDAQLARADAAELREQLEAACEALRLCEERLTAWQAGGALQVEPTLRAIVAAREVLGSRLFDLTPAQRAELLSRVPDWLVLPPPLEGVPMLERAAARPTEPELLPAFKAGDRISIVNAKTGEVRSYVITDLQPPSSLEAWARAVEDGEAHAGIDVAVRSFPEREELLRSFSRGAADLDERLRAELTEAGVKGLQAAHDDGVRLINGDVLRTIRSAGHGDAPESEPFASLRVLKLHGSDVYAVGSPNALAKLTEIDTGPVVWHVNGSYLRPAGFRSDREDRPRGEVRS